MKDNHPDLLDAIEKLFQDIPDTVSQDTTHPILREPIYIKRTVENHMGDLKQGVSKQAQVSTRIWSGQV